MAEPLQIQMALDIAPDVVYHALTDSVALSAWFAEYADVALAEKRYDFWGRFTPDVPDQAGGRHPITSAVANHRLSYQWSIKGQPTTVDYLVGAKDGKTVLVVQQDNLNPDQLTFELANEDFWFLSLENLRRHLDGKPVTRCDFTMSMFGDVQHSAEIDAPAETVWDALISPAQVNRWIASSASIEPRVGGRYDLGWGEGLAAVKILELIPNEKLAYTWSERGAEDTVVTWTLAGSGGKTRLTLIHSGFADSDDNAGIKVGWLNFLSWVRSLSEYGAGWQPAIKRLQPQSQPYYAAGIWAAQAVWAASSTA